ncbi:IS1096 element passenger TnpR family protein [Phocaeicola abscessus]|uniref:IS1096 element passenger TnpR family protein n=1 Tax=Phocaeicola abscessus TaxID=555313 RepID=UPI0004ADBFB9|nr:hypothetical protein [Phocaeicola abscessus]
MIYKFTILSDETDNFVRIIQIDADATFYDFHKAIQKACDYKDDQLTSFFICEDDWEKREEITLEDMGHGWDEDIFLMKHTKISDLVEDEKQKLIYVFDPLTDRSLFIELTEIITGKALRKPVCSRKEGHAPKQTVDFDEIMAKTLTDSQIRDDLDEELYGDREFNEDDIDMESFDISEGNPYTNSDY